MRQIEAVSKSVIIAEESPAAGNALAMFDPEKIGVAPSRWWPRLILLALAVGTLGLLVFQSQASGNLTPGRQASDSLVEQALFRAVPAANADTNSSITDADAVPDPTQANLSLASPFDFRGTLTDRSRAVQCLALAAWYEAGNDQASQRSVIQVILNRVAHPSFPSSVCGVVFEGSYRATGCQFTFTCDGSMLRRKPSATALAQASALAEAALSGAIDPSVFQATHYHADYVVPWWSKSLERLGVVGRHIFYRWPGGRGALARNPGSTSELAVADLLPDARAQMSADLQGAAGEIPWIAIDDENLLAASAALSVSANIVSVPVDDAIFLAVDPAGASGRWAISALENCRGQRTCQVLGYSDQAQIRRNRMVEGRDRERPLFLFIRDKTSGMDVALWDCRQTSRPDASQCLPESDRELRRLLRDRS